MLFFIFAIIFLIYSLVHYVEKTNREIAQQIQQRLVPHENPKISGFDVAGYCIPAREVGGDYYDFIPDGFTEAMNPSKQEYSEARLTRMIKKHLNSPAAVLNNAIIEDVQLFTAGTEMHDDMTMIAIKAEPN
jgi:serine phosphatase RsbU (regulator of sigma subunit)